MEVFVLQDNGRKKKITRHLVVRCLACRKKLDCPSSGDFWGWLKSVEVDEFRAVHLLHADPNRVGAEMEIIESDD
jgi:hypothetical protein